MGLSMKRFCLLPLLAAATCLSLFPVSPACGQTASSMGVWSARPMDWPYCRGPEMNGISREKGLVDRWSPHSGPGSNLLWLKKNLAGRSTPIVMNGNLYTIVRDKPETKEESEAVVCVDAATGNEIWRHRFNVYLSEVPDFRVAWSSVVGDPASGDVYALGVCDYFVCLDGRTGKKKWDHSLSEEYGMLSTYGGRTNFPIIHGNLVIISGIVIGWGDMAKPAHRFIAFDRRNGQAIWFNQTRLFPFDTTFSAPVITVINGEPQLIIAGGDGDLHGMQPQTGKLLWNYHISPKRGVNVTPLVVGNVVICGHSEENVGDTTMGALFAVDASKRGLLTKQNGGELWRHTQWEFFRSSPIVVNGFVYAIDKGGKLRAVELKSGKPVDSVTLGGTASGSPIYADGKIYCCTENGIWWTLEPQKNGKLRRVFRARLNHTDVNGSPIVSHGRIYLPTSKGIYCIGKKGAKPTADPRPDFPSEAPLASDTQPAQVQLVPVESLLKPKQSQQYQVRLFNSRGQFLRIAKPGEAKFELKGPGKIDANGLLSTGAHKNAHPVYVSAKVGKLVGKARVRVVPDLPWSVDFNNGVIPITWVGIRYRHIPLDFEVFKEFRYTQKDLLAARTYIFFQTNFVNGQRGGPPNPTTLTFNNRSPGRTFDAYLNYLDLEGQITSLDAAKVKLNPVLDKLKKSRIIADYKWSESPATGTQLVVTKGPRKIDGNGVMFKIHTIPLGQKSQGWMGHTTFSNYTIQADVLGEDRVSHVKQGGKKVTIRRMPEIGLSAQRYAIVLNGQDQKLEIRTWHAQKRMANSVPFKWEPHVWYTLKMQTAVQGGKAVLRGKCWERGKPEPKAWTVTAEDPVPNLEGSPGTFGSALHAELFYDNLKVYKN
jgi:outer membrane protein assembly factor BamB